MKTIYWIIGIMAGLLVLRMLTLLGFRLAARYFLKKLVGDKALDKQPDRINLKRIDKHAWNNSESVGIKTEQLLSNGFTEAGTFLVPEFPGLALKLFNKSEESISSCIYEHPKVGVWMDFFTRYQDGTGITFSTSKNPGLDQRPGHPVIYSPESDANGLYSRAIAERPKETAMLRIGLSQLPEYFEKAYAESMAWRRKKGISGLEVAKVAKAKIVMQEKKDATPPDA